MSDCNNTLKPKTAGELLCTSDIACYDGVALSCVSVPAGANLNQVISSIDRAICALNTPSAPVDASDVTYSGTLVFSCLTLTATDVQTAIQELATEICNLSSTVSNLCTDDIATCNVTWDCYTSQVGWVNPTTITEALNAIIDYTCDLKADLLSGVDNGGNGNGAGNPTFNDISNFISDINGFDDNGGVDWVAKGGDAATSPTTLDVTIDDNTGGTESEFYVNGYWMEVVPTILTMTASRDNYIDIKADGTFSITDVALGAPAPPVAADAMRLWLISTDGTGTTGSTDLRNFYVFDGTNFADDSILTRHILDGDVINSKLDNIIVAGTIGDADFMEIAYNTKGRIEIASSKISITALADNDILQYNLGTDSWENVSIAGSLLPAASANDTLYYNGAAYAASSLLTNTGTAIGIGITTGTAQQEFTLSNAGFNSQLAIPSGEASVAGTGGSLAANTYYYVVVANDGTNETIASGETSTTVDGATTTSITISWNEVLGANKYRVYKGTSTGVYTEYFEVTDPTYFDDGTAGTGGSPLQTTNIEGYGVSVANGTIQLGVRQTIPDSVIDANNIVSTLNTVGNFVQGAFFDSGNPLDYYAAKFENTVSTVGQTNYGGWFNVSGSDTNNWAIYVNAGNTFLGNVGIGADTLDATGVSTLTMKNGTAPASSPLDTFAMYSEDFQGNLDEAAPHFRTEDGNIIGLQADTGWADPTGTTDKSTFDTSTVTTQDLAEFVKGMYEHLKAMGILKA